MDFDDVGAMATGSRILVFYSVNVNEFIMGRSD